jgi:hypothetical protein
MHIRERGPHPAQNLLETLETGALAGERDLLDHVIPEVPVSGIDPPLVQDLLNKSANNTADLVHRNDGLLPVGGINAPSLAAPVG